MAVNLFGTTTAYASTLSQLRQLEAAQNVYNSHAGYGNIKTYTRALEGDISSQEEQAEVLKQRKLIIDADSRVWERKNRIERIQNKHATMRLWLEVTHKRLERLKAHMVMFLAYIAAATTVAFALSAAFWAWRFLFWGMLTSLQ